MGRTLVPETYAGIFFKCRSLWPACELLLGACGTGEDNRFTEGFRLGGGGDR
jgi:hypothetical protein